MFGIHPLIGVQKVVVTVSIHLICIISSFSVSRGVNHRMYFGIRVFKNLIFLCIEFVTRISTHIVFCECKSFIVFVSVFILILILTLVLIFIIFVILSVLILFCALIFLLISFRILLLSR